MGSGRLYPGHNGPATGQGVGGSGGQLCFYHYANEGRRVDCVGVSGRPQRALVKKGLLDGPVVREEASPLSW